MSYSGKHCVVTGGNAGIGYEIVRSLTQQGAFVIIACRSIAKGKSAADKIRSEYEDCKIEVMELDLSNLESIRTFAKTFLEKKYPLHYLFNNAGISGTGTGLSACKDEITADGFDLVWQTNYLGHFLLTSLLFPRMQESSPSRIINVSSAMHEAAPRKVNFNLAAKKTLTSAYAVSKLAQILFTYEFQRRYSINSGVQSIAVHPGGVDTDIWDRHPIFKHMLFIRRSILLTPEQAAFVAISSGLVDSNKIKNSFKYFAPHKQFIPQMQIPNDVIALLCCLKPGSHEISSSKVSYDPELAKELWRVSESLLNHTFVESKQK
jgi:NAD(P)-dependent dehydrogenase (short-subunit alcohol dehydrogenase family)